MTSLLTAEEVGKLLHLKRRAVLALDIPRVRVGAGRGKVLFKVEDVERYIRSHTEEREINNGRRVQKRAKAVGVQGLPSWDQLLIIRLGY
jgi:hypothetical protein